MKPISNEDRKRILKHKANGENVENIAKWLMIGVSTVYQILRLNKKTGSHLPKPYKGNNRKITAEQDEEIRKKIKKAPDTTIKELIENLELNVTESGLSKHLKKMGFSYKKRLSIQRINKGKMLSKQEKNGEKNKKI